MLKYIKQAYLLLFCFMVVSCNSENGLREIQNIPETIVEYDTSSPVQEKPKLDVLLVLDNSCSMITDWDYITYGITKIPEELNDNNFDWKIAIVSMDTSDAIFMELDPASIDPGWDMLTLISDFKLVAGQAEEGFSAAITAKTRYSSWFRSGVLSLIIFISDEKEQSDISPQDFHSLWSDQHIIASIVGPYSVLPGESYCAEPAEKYHLVSQIVIDICTRDRWSVIEPLLP
jgi:hypothetical protein